MKTRKQSKNYFTVDFIKSEIFKVEVPKQWRKGQFIFNRVEELYGPIAREVQFYDNVDCFYNDANINPFLEKVCERLNK
jgi:hypothetical protein